WCCAEESFVHLRWPPLTGTFRSTSLPFRAALLLVKRVEAHRPTVFG
ncbi:MAG: hypothetical protein AVDCRST_MAG83-1145, partial [uncultured Arthrobacter sp.]